MEAKKIEAKESNWYQDFKAKMYGIGLGKRIEPITKLMDKIDKKIELQEIDDVSKEDMEKLLEMINSLKLKKDETLLVRGQFMEESVHFSREAQPGAYARDFVVSRLMRRYKYLDKCINRNVSKELSTILFLARKQKGLTLTQVSEETGISESYINRMEKGERKAPTLPILQKLAKTYEVKYEDLVALAVKDESEFPTQTNSLEFEQFFLGQEVLYKGEALSLEKKQEILKVINFIEDLSEEELTNRELKYNTNKRFQRLLVNYKKVK